MASGNFVSYLRVSTDRQGRSGLGLKSQREAVNTFLNGGNWELAAEVVEVESGKRNDRPKLAEALRLCRLHGPAAENWTASHVTRISCSGCKRPAFASSPPTCRTPMR